MKSIIVMLYFRKRKFLYLALLVQVIFSCSKEKRSDKAAGKMQDFVIAISDYARNIDPDFIIIPQNGIELIFNNIDPGEGINTAYSSAIDGLGVEELFYDGNYAPDEERLEMLRQIGPEEKILVSEYVADNTNIADAWNRNFKEGFICFPRSSSNYDYLQIPDSAGNSTMNDVSVLGDALNYLYLINSENYASKQDFINAVAATDFDLVIMDLFFEGIEFTSHEINQLKTKANGGKRMVIAYMNIGSAEKFRYYWKKSWGLHHPLWIRRKYEGYDDEFWVKFWKKDWQEIIYGNDDSYTKKIIAAGFDGAYLDNVEAYYFLYFKD